MWGVVSCFAAAGGHHCVGPKEMKLRNNKWGNNNKAQTRKQSSNSILLNHYIFHHEDNGDVASLI